MAGKLYNPHNVAANHIVQDAPRYYDARNRDELAQVVCETIFQAEKKIRAVVKSPRSPQVSSFWAVLTDRMEKGVTYQRITDLEEIKEHGLEIVARDMNKYGIDLRILESNLIKHKFYLIDDHYLAVYHLGSVQTDSNFSGVGRITNHPNIIRRFRKRFENYKSQTIPCGFVIKKMREAASKLLLNATHLLDQEERAWVTDIIDFGKFSRFHVQANWSKSRLAEAERRVILGGILYRNVSGHLVPAFPIDEKMLRDAYMAKF